MSQNTNRQALIKADELERFLDWTSKNGMQHEYDTIKHKIFIYHQACRLGDVRLPMTAVYAPEKAGIKWEEKNHILCMVKAGMAAVGYFENGINISHKVFRAYMVRKKQGKSQIKYLKTKGKSRAGSRVRLGESEIFFNQINERISNYLDTYPIDYIGYSCSKTLWPFLFKPGSTLQNNKHLLYKIPVHIQQPTYDRMLEINGLLLKATLRMEEVEPNLLAEYFEQNRESSHEDEQW